MNNSGLLSVPLRTQSLAAIGASVVLRTAVFGSGRNSFRVEIEALNLGARWQALREAPTTDLLHKKR